MNRRNFVQVSGAAILGGLVTNEYNKQNSINKSLERYINKTFPVISLDSRLQNKIDVIDRDSNIGLKGPTSASGTIKLEAKNKNVEQLNIQSSLVFIENVKDISKNLKPENIEKHGEIITYGSHMHNYSVENPQTLRIQHSELYQEPVVLLGVKLH